MKLSLKLQDDHHHHQQTFNPLITAKVPISIFDHPFLTTVSTNSLSSDLSFSLSSNFPSGPSVKLSYSPTSTSISSPPFSLCLKSGLGLFGSPNRSPLVFKAHFSFSSPSPTFSLHFNPQFGDFALKKTTFSNPRGGVVSGSASKPGIDANSGSGSGSSGGEIGNGFVHEGSSVWQELKLEPRGGSDGVQDGGFYENCERSLGSKESERGGVFSGIAVMARTVFPVGKRLVVNMRWGVNLPSDLGSKAPYLTMNKIGIEFERVEKELNEERKKRSGESGNAGDLELLKGMCFWMTRDLEALERENREMKHSLEEMMKLGVSPSKRSPLQSNSAPRMPSAESSGEFERWKTRKNVKEENVRGEAKKPTSQASDLESELQRAIKAAAAAGSSM